MELSRAEWAEHLEQWRCSGETATRYCESHGLKLGSLRYWSGRIRGEADGSADEAFESSPPQFARVRRREQRERTSEAPGGLRLHVGEVQVEVPPEFDAGTLRRVLEVLRSEGGGR